MYSEIYKAKGLAAAFRNKFLQLEKLKKHEQKIGNVQIIGEGRLRFYLVTKKLLYQRSTLLGCALPKIETCC